MFDKSSVAFLFRLSIVVKTVINAVEFHVSAKKVTFDKNGDGVRGARHLKKGKWSIQTMSFRPNPFHKNAL